MEIIGWRAWYTQGRVYSSTDSKPEDLPYSGVLVIKLYGPEIRPGQHYTIVLDGADWYWWDGQTWQKIGSESWTYFVDPPDVPKKFLKQGVGASDEEFHKLSETVRESKVPP